MRKYILGLMTIALLGASPVLGQTPQTSYGNPSTFQAVPEHGPVTHGGAHVEPNCAGCQQTNTVCVPTNYVKKTTKFCYCSGCEPICLCYWRSLCGLCGGCEGGSCEAPYVRRFLIMKVRTCEECCTKCIPTEAPVGCAAPCGSAAQPAAPIGYDARLPAPSGRPHVR